MSKIIKVTPGTGAETAGWYEVVVAAHRHDLPAHVPPPGPAEVAGRLLVPPARGRAVHYAATGDDGRLLGVASLVLFTEAGNEHTAFLDLLAVRPEARRAGTGTALWEAVRADLAADGRGSVAAEVELGGAGEAFAGHLGFANALPVQWYVQRVPDEPAPRPPLPDGFGYAHWTGVVPDEHADSFAAAHNAMADAPSGDLEQQTPGWDAAKVRAAAGMIERRGGVIEVSAVLDEEKGAVAAYTELVLRDPADVRALQYDTVVVPAYRGGGLGRAVKTDMLHRLRAAHPHAREIVTSVADDNAAMLAVNEGLGYRYERSMGYFQLAL